MSMRTALLGCALAVAATAAGREEVRVPIPEGTLVLSFERARVSRQTLEAAARIGPHAEVPGLDTLLEACVPSDRAYSDCNEAKPGTKGFVRNATINLNRAVAQLRKLKALKAPKGLERAYEFQWKNGVFYVWLLRTRLEFLKTGLVSVLKKEFGDIKPAESCELAIQRVERAESGDKAFRIARSDWHNCVNHVFNERIGKYPRKEWDAFLKKYGVYERIVSGDKNGQ